jgi:two-component system sensor histidine kinase/response regulator
MKGDQEPCSAAGMDGYLIKPIRPQELDTLLQGYVARRTAAEIRTDAGLVLQRSRLVGSARSVSENSIPIC